MKVTPMLPHMRTGLLALVLLLSACGRNEAKQEGPPPEALDLTCSAFSTVTGASLEQRFGAANVVEQERPGPEGETYIATVVFPNEPARRIEIVWRDLEAREVPMAVAVRDAGSNWVGRNGITIGTELEDVERLNGRPFKLYGFNWDYGGYVSGWNGGSMEDPACRISARFTPTAEGVEYASGDTEFQSDAEGVRAAKARVEEIGLGFSHPDDGQ
jgi:hypothetical protein